MSQPNKKIIVVLFLFVAGIMILGLVTAFFSDLPKLAGVFHSIKIEPLSKTNRTK